jgi:membrane protein implicated in regulation of membrane protease activity
MDGLILLAFLIPAFFVISIIILLVKSSSQQRSLSEINDKLQQVIKQLENKTAVKEKIIEKEETAVS